MVKVNKSAHELLHVLNKHETFTRVHPCKPPLSRGQIGSVAFFVKATWSHWGRAKVLHAVLQQPFTIHSLYSI